MNDLINNQYVIDLNVDAEFIRLNGLLQRDGILLNEVNSSDQTEFERISDR